MRIVSGTLGGRTIVSPKNRATHPMSDKVRGGLFNALGELDGLTVCDMFAGSGALGIEALSRQASHATFIESDAAAQRAINENIATLGLKGQAKLIKASVQAWLTTAGTQTFDIILCDPPYDNVHESTVAVLGTHLSQDGVLVLSWPGKTELPVLEGVSLVRQKSYGDAQLAFYKK